MLRRSSTMLLVQNGRGISSLYRGKGELVSSLLLSRTAVSSSSRVSTKGGCDIRNKVVVNSFRRMSTETPQPERPQEKKGVDDDDENSIMLTPGEKVVVASRFALWAGVAVFAGICGYFIACELMPTKMSPNSVFSKSLDIVKTHPEVTRRLGFPIHGYGRDGGGKRVGRRNFIEHTEFKSPDDGSKRTRVRYNIEGPNGRKAFVFAEVSSAMPSGEFVYVLVQNKHNGDVVTIIDNRAALALNRMTSGASQEGKSVMNQLLTGGEK